MASTESLSVNRELLDPNFDGYKLSLDSLPIYDINVGGVDSVKLRDDEYTLQHVKAFGITNHLTLDQWQPSNVLYVDNTGSIMLMRVILESDLSLPREVFNIPRFNDIKKCHRHNVTMHFPSADLCVLSDGAGTLYVLDTGRRDTEDGVHWKVLFHQELSSDSKPFTILHSTSNVSDSSRVVHCLVLHIEEKGKKIDEGTREEEEGMKTDDSTDMKEKKGKGAEEEMTTDSSNTDTKKSSSQDTKKSSSSQVTYEVILEWFSISKKSDSAEFKLTRSRQFKGKTAPTYAAIDESGQCVFIASPANFELVKDSAKEIAKKKEEEQNEQTKDKTLYTWTQTEEDVIVTFILPETVNRQEIHFNVTADRLELGIKDKVMLLEGALHRSVDPPLCTWTFNKRKLEVMLTKREEGPMWADLVIGDHRGQYIVDPDQARRIHEKLEHLTTADLDADPIPSSGGTGIGANDLEECDMCTDENTSLVRYDAENHTILNEVHIGSYQCLFTTQLDPSLPPCICLRHDVDGLIWQPRQPTDDIPQPWQHINTFNALGYVQASKQERKFTSCPPNASYVVICDCIRHLYIYRQPTPTENSLRNRKSGRMVGAIAKQQLISLDSTEDILGIHATDERIFVLTSSKLYIIRVSV